MLEWFWYTKARKVFYMLIGVIAIAFSVGVFLLEVLTFLNNKNSVLSTFINLFVDADQGFYKTQVFLPRKKLIH